MNSPARLLAFAIAAAFALAPVAALAGEDLLVQKDFHALSDDDQWRANDIWCVAGIDLALEEPGYSRGVLGFARSQDVDEFMGKDGATQGEFDANLAFALDQYRAELAAGTMTIDQMLEGCIASSRH